MLQPVDRRPARHPVASRRRSLLGASLDIYIFAAVVLAVPVFGLYDISRRSEQAFRASGRSRTVWVVIQIVVPILGTLAYYAFVRPRVRARGEFEDR
jgi:predicted MFS family arabinose efflux permease